jgi:hypothetical protein
LALSRKHNEKYTELQIRKEGFSNVTDTKQEKLQKDEETLEIINKILNDTENSEKCLNILFTNRNIEELQKLAEKWKVIDLSTEQATSSLRQSVSYKQ